MKKSLGRLLILLLLGVTTPLSASELASYTLTANKSEAFVKEALTITFTARQQDHTNVMFFFLTPHKSPDYEIKLLKKKTTELGYHNYTTTFTYILFALKPKDISVGFDFTVKEASDQAVAQVYTGSRDNVKWIETIDTKIPTEPLTLHIQPLKEKVDLVGDFQLTAKINKEELTQYDSATLLYKLSGQGFKENNITLLRSIPGVSIFSEVHDAYSKLTPSGYKIDREFLYALSAKEDFRVPAVELKAFSPKDKRYYTLQAPAFFVKVNKIEPSTLLDNKESPSSEPLVSWQSIKEFLIALGIFAMGYITALIAPKFHRRKKEKEYADILNASTPKELLEVLTQHYASTMQEEIKLLEVLVYNNKNAKNTSVGKLKKSILKKLKRAS